MSKYQRGCYHYDEFRRDTPYRRHVLDLLQVVQKHVPADSDVLDVGAGEGLILHKLRELGYVCTGIEKDKHALALAADKGNEVGNIDFLHIDYSVDAVLMLDVLEHVDDPVGFVEHAKNIARVIVIAIPDRKDPHAVHEIKHNDVLDFFDDLQWTNVHDETRHARHLLVFKREAEEIAVPELDEESETPNTFDLQGMV
jgi:SAM-dependent methyltransferase